MNDPKAEVFYAWREYASVHDECGPSEKRLLVPMSDPMEYEYPMDWIFPTVEAAKESKSEFFPEQDWYLVKVTTEPIERVTS